MADRGTGNAPSLPASLLTAFFLGEWSHGAGASFGTSVTYTTAAGVAAATVSADSRVAKTRSYGAATAAIFGPW